MHVSHKKQHRIQHTPLLTNVDFFFFCPTCFLSHHPLLVIWELKLSALFFSFHFFWVPQEPHPNTRLNSEFTVTLLLSLLIRNINTDCFISLLLFLFCLIYSISVFLSSLLSVCLSLSFCMVQMGLLFWRLPCHVD